MICKDILREEARVERGGKKDICFPLVFGTTWGTDTVIVPDSRQLPDVS